ncbi:MAG: MinD/ParA family protein [Deltaproteobacteria bacterium]|jgi:flagellar biosynthesis protein FlhG|nr:MinD/ParA family protein [Deltaproteobacteria bacterium]
MKKTPSATAPAAPSKPVRVIAVSSGKGGVGKSNLTLNLALALASLKKKTLILDADLGLANTDVLLGIRTKYTIHDWLKGEKTLSEIVVQVPGGISVLPAASGILELSDIGAEEKNRLITDFESLQGDLDYALIDAAAGIGPNVVFFNLVSTERIVVVTNEPTSITDAYAFIKALSTKHHKRDFYVLPNMTRDYAEAKEVFKLLSDVAGHYLTGVSLDLLGYVPRDDAVPDAVRRQTPFFSLYPASEASRRILEVARTLNSKEVSLSGEGGLALFFNRLGAGAMRVN